MNFHELNSRYLIACSENDIDELKTILGEKSFIPSQQGLFNSITLNNIESIKILLDDGRIEIDNIINRVIFDNNIDIIKLFLKYPGFNPFIDNNRYISDYISLMNSENEFAVFEILVNDNRFDPSLNSNVVIFDAFDTVLNGKLNYKLVDYLIDSPIFDKYVNTNTMLNILIDLYSDAYVNLEHVDKDIIKNISVLVEKMLGKLTVYPYPETIKKILDLHMLKNDYYNLFDLFVTYDNLKYTNNILIAILLSTGRDNTNSLKEVNEKYGKLFKDIYEQYENTFHDKKLNISGYDNELFILICSKGKTDLLKFIINNPSIDVSAQNYKGFKLAKENGHDDLYSRLKNHTVKKIQFIYDKLYGLDNVIDPDVLMEILNYIYPNILDVISEKEFLFRRIPKGERKRLYQNISKLMGEKKI